MVFSFIHWSCSFGAVCLLLADFSLLFASEFSVLNGLYVYGIANVTVSICIVDWLCALCFMLIACRFINQTHNIDCLLERICFSFVYHDRAAVLREILIGLFIRRMLD